MAIAALGSDQPNELVIASVVRASFCEGLLRDMGLDDLAQDGFFVGLFSTIDALLGRPLPEAVDRLPVSEEVRTALLGGDNALRRVYNVVLAWERGAWDEVSLAAAGLGLQSNEIAARYKSAVEFGNSVASTEAGRPGPLHAPRPPAPPHRARRPHVARALIASFTAARAKLDGRGTRAITLPTFAFAHPDTGPPGSGAGFAGRPDPGGTPAAPADMA